MYVCIRGSTTCFSKTNLYYTTRRLSQLDKRDRKVDRSTSIASVCPSYQFKDTDLKKQRPVARIDRSIARVICQTKESRNRVSRGCRLKSKRKCHRLQPEDDDPLFPYPTSSARARHQWRRHGSSDADQSPLDPPPPLSVTSPFARELPPVTRDTLSLSPEGTLSISSSESFCTYIYIYIYIYTCIHIYIYTRTRTRARTHTYESTMCDVRRVETRNGRREIACAFRNVIGANENRSPRSTTNTLDDRETRRRR